MRSPFGLDSLRRAPKPVWWSCAGLGLACLLAAGGLAAGPWRGGAIVLGVLLADCAQEGLREELAGLLRARWRELLAGLALLGLAWLLLGPRGRGSGEDPELAWRSDGAYRRGVEALSVRAVSEEESAFHVRPFEGRASFEVDLAPAPGARTELWLDLPIGRPESIPQGAVLSYAIRVETDSALIPSVQLKTSRGYLYERPCPDQEGLASDGAQRLDAQARGRWYARRIALGSFAGARIESVGLLVFQPEGVAPPTRLVVYLDAVRIEQ